MIKNNLKHFFFFLFYFTFAFGINSSKATPLTADVVSPTADTSYQDTVEISYTLDEAPQAGSVQLVFTGDTTITMTLSNDTSATFDLNTSSTTSSFANVVSSTPTSIPDGVYTVSLTYKNTSGEQAPTTTVDQVYINETPPPVLAIATSDDTISPLDGIPITYTLPVDPLAGSVVVTIFNEDNTYQVSLPDTSGEDLTATLDTAGHFADGTYTVTLSYQDSLGNPAATTSVSDVVLLTPSSTPESSSCRFNSMASSGSVLFELMILFFLTTVLVRYTALVKNL